ncbi:MAG: hypothetical protein AB7F25_11850 [Deferribacterales bacterium]
MRKLLVALMMVAFAATAFAADITFSGSYEVDGKYEKNYNLASEDVGTSQYYEHDFDLWMNVQTDKDTFFKTKLELLDGDWVSSAGGKDSVYQDSDHTQFSVQRAWLGHKFDGVLVEAGLMNSGTWGYAFADDAEGNYRVKATFDVAGGKLSILTQKSAELSDGTKDSNKDDSDKYSIGYKGTFGGILVAPKLDYDIKSNSDVDGGFDGKDTKVLDLDVAAGGKFGAINLETEFKYSNITYADEVASTTQQDYDLFGIYANVNYNYGAGVVGFLTAYGSADKDAQKGFDFDDDFDSTFILGDDLGLGGGDDLTGFWANALYATYDVNEKLNLMGKIAYATSNWEDNALEDASAWEIDGAATYAITKELSYYFNVGYAMVDLDASEDPDDLILVKHGLILSF